MGILSKRKQSVIRKYKTTELSLETQFDEALEMLEKLGANRQKAMRRILSGLGSTARSKVKKAYKSYGLHKSSGDLYKSITRRVVRSGKGVIVEAKARNEKGVYYGYALAKGAKIEAKKADYLTFQKDGKWIKAHSVKLPERDFVAKPVVDYLKTQDFKERFDALMQKEIDRVQPKGGKA